MNTNLGHSIGITLAAIIGLQLASSAEEPKHTTVYENDFEKNIELDMWSNFHAGKAPNGGRFLGLYQSRETVYQKLPKLPEHRFVRLQFDLIIALSWEAVRLVAQLREGETGGVYEFRVSALKEPEPEK